MNLSQFLKGLVLLALYFVLVLFASSLPVLSAAAYFACFALGISLQILFLRDMEFQFSVILFFILLVGGILVVVFTPCRMFGRAALDVSPDAAYEAWFANQYRFKDARYLTQYQYTTFHHTSGRRGSGSTRFELYLVPIVDSTWTPDREIKVFALGAGYSSAWKFKAYLERSNFNALVERHPNDIYGEIRKKMDGFDRIFEVKIAAKPLFVMPDPDPEQTLRAQWRIVFIIVASVLAVWSMLFAYDALRRARARSKPVP